MIKIGLNKILINTDIGILMILVLLSFYIPIAIIAVNQSQAIVQETLNYPSSSSIRNTIAVAAIIIIIQLRKEMESSLLII